MVRVWYEQKYCYTKISSTNILRMKLMRITVYIYLAAVRILDFIYTKHIVVDMHMVYLVISVESHPQLQLCVGIYKIPWLYYVGLAQGAIDMS